MEVDKSDKPQYIQSIGTWGPLFPIFVDSFYRDSMESLLAVDELIQDVRSKLVERGFNKNTVIIYTSDNGLLFGEHDYIGKLVPYEESIRVPLAIYCPFCLTNGISKKLVYNVDLTSTIVDLTGIDFDTYGGKSLLPILNGESVNWRTVIVSGLEDPPEPTLYFNLNLPGWFMLRGENWKRVQYTSGEIEYYDLSTDPYEMNNLE